LYWVKTDEPTPSKPVLSQDELHLCYLGSINNVIDIDYIVRMCNEVSVHKKVVLHIIGDGEKRAELLHKAKESGAEVIYHGLVYDSKKKQAIFDQCYFGLNIMKSSVCVGLTMKSLDYFQAGLPIINNIDGDTADMIRDYHIGFNGYHALLQHMEELEETNYLAMRENVRNLYYKKFTKEAFFKRLEEND
jgi:glycosyltransferase involved in cell wall biosynthesis